MVGVFLFLLIAFVSFSQAPSGTHRENSLPVYGTVILDSMGRPFQNSYQEVTGNPFFLEEWKYGTILLTNKSVVGPMPLRLNLKDQQVHFRRTDGVEMYLKPGMVRQITLLDTVKGIPRETVFQSGFPPKDRQNDNSFYQVLRDGKLKFLLFIRKSIHVEKDFFSGDVKREFRITEEYYFYTAGSLERIHKNKEEILEFMDDHRKLMDEYVKANKISFKSADDIMKLVDYYNTL